MSEKEIKALVEGGKATPGPPLGPALGPMGINAGLVVKEINEKTKAFEGTTVPVKVFVDPAKKTFRIEVGTPSVAAMIKKEIGVEKGSGKAAEIKVGELTIDQIIKIANAKKDSTLARTRKAHVKEVIGACIPMGVLIDGKDPREVQKEVDNKLYDLKIDGKQELVMPSKQEINEKKKKYSAMAEKAAAAKPVEEKPTEAAAEEKK